MRYFYYIESKTHGVFTGYTHVSFSNLIIRLATMKDIKEQSLMEDIQSISYKQTECYGCVNDKCSQFAHSECPGGCMHLPCQSCE